MNFGRSFLKSFKIRRESTHLSELLCRLSLVVKRGNRAKAKASPKLGRRQMKARRVPRKASAAKKIVVDLSDKDIEWQNELVKAGDALLLE